MGIYNETKTWNRFFAEFDSLLPQHMLQVEIPHIDLTEAQTFFQTFSHKRTQFLEYDGTINIWEVAGIGHNEVRNCAVLGWFLDYYGSHGQKGLFLQAFLDGLNKASQGKTNFTVQGPYRIRLENCYDQGESRVDIVIESADLLLFIEAKIDAPDTRGQSDQYSVILNSRSEYTQRGLVYLTPKGHIPRCENKQYLIPFSWRHIANAFECIADRASTGTQTSQPYWVPLVQQFCWHIRQF